MAGKTLVAKCLVLRLFALIFVVAAGGRAEEVNLSHLVVSVQTDAIDLGIDYGRLVDFCGDSDGCQIVVKLERPAAAVTMTARLFLNAGEANRWFSSETAGAYFLDSDNNIDAALSLVSGPNACVVTDGDYLTAPSDLLPGFLAWATGGLPNPALCTFTISD